MSQTPRTSGAVPLAKGDKDLLPLAKRRGGDEKGGFILLDLHPEKRGEALSRFDALPFAFPRDP